MMLALPSLLFFFFPLASSSASSSFCLLLPVCLLICSFFKADFGPLISTLIPGLEAYTVVEAVPYNACTALTSCTSSNGVTGTLADCSGHVVIVSRGFCAFIAKTINVQTAGRKAQEEETRECSVFSYLGFIVKTGQ